MKKQFLLISIVLFMLNPGSGFAQKPLSEKQKRMAALVILQSVSDFQRNLSSLIGQPITDIEPQVRLTLLDDLRRKVHPEARFENDLDPQRMGSQRFDFEEYVKRANVLDYPEGLLNYALDLKNVRIGKSVNYTSNGYLMVLYTTKELSGQYKGRQMHRKTGPCRIGVYFDWKDEKAKNCRIGFMDGQPADQSAFFLHEEAPHDYLTLDEMVKYLAQHLTKALPGEATKLIQVEALSYNDLGVVSELGMQVSTALLKELRQLNPGLKVSVPSRSWAQEVLTIKGSFREEGESLRFRVRLYDRENQPVGEEVSAAVPVAELADAIWRPDADALAAAAEVQNALKKEASLLAENPFRFHLRTDRGESNLLYFAEDTMRIFVRSEKPCYYRVIYRDAENHLVLLQDSEPLTPAQLSQWQQVARNKDFVVTGPPYGPEHLIAFAAAVPFAPLRTRKVALNANAQGAEEYITYIEDDLATVKKLSTSGLTGQSTAPVVEQVITMNTRQRR